MAVVPELLKCLRNPYRAVRHLSSRCLAVFSSLDSVTIMQAVVDHILPMLNATDNDTCRQGAAEAIACIIEKLQFDIVPYIVLLVIPLLGKLFIIKNFYVCVILISVVICLEYYISDILVLCLCFDDSDKKMLPCPDTSKKMLVNIYCNYYVYSFFYNKILVKEITVKSL